MNQFIQALDSVLEHSDQYTEEVENDLLDHIFDNSPYQGASEFSKSNLSYYDALDMVQSDDAYLAHAEEYVATNSDSAVLPHDHTKLAYHLAYNDPEYGANLLTELLYYQSKRRFTV